MQNITGLRFQITALDLDYCREVLGYEDLSVLTTEEAKAAIKMIDICRAVVFLNNELGLAAKLQTIVDRPTTQERRTDGDQDEKH